MKPIEQFRILSGRVSLSRACFDAFPAWSEFYDPEELDLIASWGVPREWLNSQVDKLHEGSSHAHYTILDLDNLPHDNMRIFLKAEFKHSCGARIDGFIMNADAYCISIFIGNEEYHFSRNSLLRDEAEARKRTVERQLGIASLFPLEYHTEFVDRNGKKIEGSFELQKK